MKRLRLIITLFSLSMWLLPFDTDAQSATALDSLEKASVSALAWFKSLAKPIGEIVAAEERNQLLDALSDLSKDIYSIEQDKQVFIQLLKRDMLDRQAINSRTEKLMMSIDSARKSLRKVGPLLRQQYKVGGVEVEELLSEAAIARKIWVSELHDAPYDPVRRQASIAEGDRALKALHDANVELSRLITKL